MNGFSCKVSPLTSNCRQPFSSSSCRCSSESQAHSKGGTTMSLLLLTLRECIAQTWTWCQRPGTRSSQRTIFPGVITFLCGDLRRANAVSAVTGAASLSESEASPLAMSGLCAMMVGLEDASARGVSCKPQESCPTMEGHVYVPCHRC